MANNRNRTQHQEAVIKFLRNNLLRQNWEINLPPYGTGNETYVASSGGKSFFVKLDTSIDRYQVMASLGLTPKVAASGSLQDGTAVIVQEWVKGQTPTRKDFYLYARQFARAVRRMHNSELLIRVLPERASQCYKDVGQDVLHDIVTRWAVLKHQVPSCAGYVDEMIAHLEQQIAQLPGAGLVASHGDICNGNWLVAEDGNIYLLDFDLMCRDDPALDLGAILWWYYPPELRNQFLEDAGYKNETAFRHRMRIRMAVHSLNIIIPRENSFDHFNADSFDERLEDFKALMDGKENPQGYGD